MARFTRRTVKVALTSALLASAGAGTYFVTTSDGSWLANWRGPGKLEAEADDDSAAAAEPVSQSELDAVASVWKDSQEPTEAQADAPQVVSAEPETDPAAGQPGDDRYEIETTAGANEEAARYSGAAIPVMLPAMPAQDVTRGQEPTEYATVEDADAAASAEPSAGEEGVESSRRAREAFGDDVAAAPAPLAAASDRYGSDSAASQPPAPAGAGASNPFAEPSTLR